jgi:DNA-binding GntR family transcriptional regulator
MLVQAELEKMILEGKFLPGDPLRETGLSTLLGVSRGPIREAFRGLEEKGLVQVEKNCGVQVRTLSIEEADQIYDVRICLEQLIGRNVAMQLTKAGDKELSQIIGKMENAAKQEDVNPYTSLNFAFHDALARLSGNPKLHETYSRLVSQLSLFRRKTYIHNRNSMLASLAEHKQIYAAVEQKNADLASDLLSGHAKKSKRSIHECNP